MEHISKISRSYDRDSSYVKQETEEEQNATVLAPLSDKQKTYSMVYHGVTARFGLNPTESLFVATIFSLSRKYGYCTAGLNKLASVLNVSVPTIISTIKNLEEIGLIKKAKDKSKYGTNKLKVSKEVNDCIKYIKEQITLEREQNKEKQQRKKNDL